VAGRANTLHHAGAREGVATRGPHEYRMSRRPVGVKPRASGLDPKLLHGCMIFVPQDQYGFDFNMVSI
jgi:hypothetical protein